MSPWTSSSAIATCLKKAFRAVVKAMMKAMIMLLFALTAVVLCRHSKDELGKLRVKALKRLLTERGVQCVGCVEKAEFVERVMETQELPTGPFCARKTFNLMILHPTIEASTQRAPCHHAHRRITLRAALSGRRE
jgi:hypothetical protein